MALAEVNEAATPAAVEQLVAAGQLAIAIQCDVAVKFQIEAMVELNVAKFGRLDVAFNNAGVNSPVAETADASGKEFDHVMA